MDGEVGTSAARAAVPPPPPTPDRLPPDAQPPPSLPLPLRGLFALHGASFQLPNLALMSILNDRAAVPPAYLPAYGAICFLPWSLKPVYAYLSSAILRRTASSGGARHKDGRGNRHVLIAVLLGLSGLSYVGTAFVPPGGVASCFVWGFVRGVAGSWPEFLLGVTLVETARRDAALSSSTARQRGDSDGQDSGGRDAGDEAWETEEYGEEEEQTAPQYEELGSVFQSQAATSRNVGSLTAATLTFFLFAWRHYRHVETELSTAIVSALLFLTAGLSIVGSAVALRYKVGTVDDPMRTGGGGDCVGTTSADESQTPLAGRTNRRRGEGRYQGVSTAENDLGGDDTPHRLHLELSPDRGKSSSGASASVSSQSKQLQQRLDIASLALFQSLLVLAALQGPIVSVATSAVWISLVALVGVALVSTLVAASCYQYREDGNEFGHAAAGSPENDPIPPRRLALYLILRHSIPSPGYVMYSFLYSLFSAVPLLMELLSIMGSVGSTLASWCYQRFVAKKYNSGWSIISLIAVLTIVGALFSLLDIITVHLVGASISTGGGDESPLSLGLCSLVFSLYILTGFIAEFKFMPSVVLATTNVVSDDPEEVGCTGRQDSRLDGAVDDSVDGESGATKPRTGRPQYDESMQYASFVSCIDFGGQISSWATVPIISSLGISRDNGWKNLDRLIVICALAHMASVAFLCIIRPARQPLPPTVTNMGGILS